jgi:hypothetical protein
MTVLAAREANQLGHDFHRSRSAYDGGLQSAVKF